MFDFHMHTTVSFDGKNTAREMADAAEAKGLKEICFTDHWDCHYEPEGDHDLFSLEAYAEAYDSLRAGDVKIRKGIEFGMTDWNAPMLKERLSNRRFDFVIGSCHYAGTYDPYMEEYWQGRTVHECFKNYFEHILSCLRIHTDFDVLGHLTYVCKSPNNPTRADVPYPDFRETTDEIFRILIDSGKGIEINTSGIDRAGVFLPSVEYLKRYRELGGEIITVGSDAHSVDRVGQYVPEALELLKDIFGYVCTFEDRKPIFHKL